MGEHETMQESEKSLSIMDYKMMITPLTVAMTFKTAAKAISLSDLVMPVFSDTAETKSAFLKFTTSTSVDDFFLDAAFLEAFLVAAFFASFLTA